MQEFQGWKCPYSNCIVFGEQGQEERIATTFNFVNVNVYNANTEEQWKILLYETLQGDSPVNDFILTLGLKAQSKVRTAIKMLQEFDIRLGLPHIKKLRGTELWELRILGGDSIRILYIAISGKNFLLLHGFKKKKDKTPPKEIKVAEDRLAEFRLRP